jgi:hypothetical protein
MRRFKQELRAKQMENRMIDAQKKRLRKRFESLGIRHSMSAQKREAAAVMAAIDARLSGGASIRIGGSRRTA